MPPVRSVLIAGMALLALAVGLATAAPTASAQGGTTVSWQVRGIVMDESGNPSSGHRITALETGPQPEGHERLKQRRVQQWVEDTGEFTLSLPDGFYHLHIWTDRGDDCAITGYEEAPNRPRAIIVAGRPIVGIVVVVSGSLQEDAQWIPCRIADEFATTTLQPGRNLAGWTGAEANVTALFEAIPRLDMATAWDTDAQVFRRAAADGSGDLRTLTPGMGLQLELGGTEPAVWTRPVLSPGGIGLVSLREGWNFVAWVGRDGIAAREAFRGLDGVLLEAWGWNAAAQQRETYALNASANTLRTLDKGDAYWVRVSGAKRWWQLAPQVAFLSAFTPAKQAELRAAVDSVVEFFARHIGIRVPGLTFQFDDVTPGKPRGSYGNEVIYLQDPFTARAHEYSHAVQEYYATIEENGRWGHVEVRYRDIQVSPRWLTEGVANYWSHRYHDETSEQTYDGRIRADIAAVRRTSARLRDLERDLGIGGDVSANYSLGTLAVDWLVTRAGEASITNFRRQRPSHPDWQAAFRAAFAISVNDFYDAFEAYRTDIAPRWLTEGVSNYWSHRYHDETSEQTYDGRIRADIIAVRRTPARLRDLERDLGIGGDVSANYSLGTLAVDWLVDRTGEASITDFYRQRPSHPDWQAAFRAVFGISVDDFYDAFEVYHAEIAPPFTVRATATTTLRPGLNLAGWTGNEASVATLFEAIPRLDMAYAWDAGAQVFRWAARDGSGDLTTLTPGMGLWLALGGTEPVVWTRPVLPPGKIGLVPLREGWNFVAWAGRDGVAPDEAFRGLDGVTEAWGWDAAAQRRETYTPSARANTLRTLDKGDAYWVRVSGAKRWWQLAPQVEFLSAFTPAKQAELRAAVDSVVEFFARHTGIKVPGLTFQFDDVTPGKPRGIYGNEVIYLQDPFTARAHEYSQAVQEYYATIEENGRWGHVEVRYGDIQVSPRWLTEGVANYWSHRYHDETSEQTYDGRIQADIIAVRRTPARLRDLEHDLGIGGDLRANYSLGTLAVDWLIDRAGEASITIFYRQRPSHPDWRAAFRAVFGISVDDFYDAFAAYRAEIAPPFTARLHGTVVGMDGEPVSRLWVAALRHPRNEGWGKGYFAAWTDAEGAFSFGLDADVYRMHVLSDQVSGCTVFSSIEREPSDAIFDIPRDAEVGMRIVVRREALPETRWSPCGWGGLDAGLAQGAE